MQVRPWPSVALRPVSWQTVSLVRVRSAQGGQLSSSRQALPARRPPGAIGRRCTVRHAARLGMLVRSGSRRRGRLRCKGALQGGDENCQRCPPPGAGNCPGDVSCVLPAASQADVCLHAQVRPLQQRWMARACMFHWPVRRHVPAQRPPGCAWDCQQCVRCSVQLTCGTCAQVLLGRPTCARTPTEHSPPAPCSLWPSTQHCAAGGTWAPSGFWAQDSPRRPASHCQAAGARSVHGRCLTGRTHATGTGAGARVARACVLWC